MKMPSLCPFCNDPMQNDYEYIWEVLHKKCARRPAHNIEFIASTKNDDYVSSIHIKLNHNTMIKWCVSDKTLVIESGITHKKSCHLPYFEPEFTTYQRLINKLKTYLVFS